MKQYLSLVAHDVACLMLWTGIVSALWVAVPVVWHAETWLGRLVLIPGFLYISCILLLHHYLVRITHPGWLNETDQDNQSERWCRVCEIYKPYRAYHCRVYDQCIPHMDHYCVWLGNTIGRDNYAYFVWFLRDLWVGTSTFLLCVIVYSRELYFSSSWRVIEPGWLSSYACVVAVIGWCASTFLCLWFAYLTLQNKTSVEFYYATHQEAVPWREGILQRMSGCQPVSWQAAMLGNALHVNQ